MMENCCLPTGPDRIHLVSYGDFDDEIYVGVIVIVTSAGYFDKVICHPDVVCVDGKIFRGRHDGELNRLFVIELIIAPFPYRANFLDGRDTIVRYENGRYDGVSRAVLYKVLDWSGRGYVKSVETIKMISESPLSHPT